MVDVNSNKKWYALYTKPRAEKKLKLTLSQKNITNFLPILNLKKKWSDRYKIVETPIFSSYIFVKIDYNSEATLVLKDPNSVQFVLFEGKPAEIK
ncbi:MAG: UpxY family transcription antiterminator, partial [Leptospiraceae bacterium]|nr:UpxY family transcription antiterminator [Leptospiraceae bacterium]